MRSRCFHGDTRRSTFLLMRRDIQQLHDKLNLSQRHSTRAGQRWKWIVWWKFRIGKRLWVWFRIWIWFRIGYDQQLYGGDCLRTG